MSDNAKVMFIQRVAAEYRTEFFSNLAESSQLRVLRGLSRGEGDVVDANLPSSIDYINNVQYFFGGRIWVHTQVVRAISKFKPDIVIVSPTLRDVTNLALFILRKRYGFKIIGWGMGEMPGRTKRRSKIHHFLQKLITDRLDTMIVYSSEARRYYKDKLGFKRHIDIAPNAVDLSSFTKIKDSFERENLFTLVYVGRIIKEKRLEELIDVVLERNDVALKVVGQGDAVFTDFLKSKINNNDRIAFVGPLYGADLNQFLIRCDLFVLPSRGGLAINHAMASGVPVLVSVGDGTEKDLIIDGKTGFMFDDSDFEMMGELIDKLKDNETLLQEVSQEAILHIHANFSIENMCRVFNVMVRKLQ